jgi:hypothetical protein
LKLTFVVGQEIVFAKINIDTGLSQGLTIKAVLDYALKHIPLLGN